MEPEWTEEDEDEFQAYLEHDYFENGEEDGDGYGFCDCTECPCNVPLEDSMHDVCPDCAEGRHMDQNGIRK